MSNDTGSQPDESFPTDAAEEVALGCRDVAMAAHRIVKRFRDYQSLAWVRPCAERGTQQRQYFVRGRTEGAGTKHAGVQAIFAKLDFLDEAPGFLDPVRVKHGARLQEEQPGRARCAGCRFEARPARER